MTIPAARLQSLAADNDVALVTLGRTSGEFLDRKKADFDLTREEMQLLESTCKAFHDAGKRVVVVLNIGGVIETASWKQLPDAILCAWQAGQEGGNSVADVLAGKASPSGKLTMTFPVMFEDAASSHNFPVDMTASVDITNSGTKQNTVRNVDFTEYEEDIYVGYRYFDTFGKQVSYPFGYGLSYTAFEYSEPVVTRDGERVEVDIEITNTGSHAGREVVQLYASAPDRKEADKPEKELKAFAKTGELKPGESQHIRLTFDCDDLASFSAEQSAWVVAPGSYELLVGASSDDIRRRINIEVEGSTASTGDILAPAQTLDLLRR